MPVTKSLFACVWLCFVVRGFFYCVAVPLWEGFDEHAHFAYVQHVALRGELFVNSQTTASGEVERSITLVPMPWTLRDEPPPHHTHDVYWRLPAGERLSRERELAALPRELGAQNSSQFVTIESQQPPLNYWLMAPIYRIFSGASLPSRVFMLRLLNLLLASAAVPAAWMAMLILFGPGAKGLAAAAASLVALMPEVMFDTARVANSGLSIALFSAFAVLCLRISDGDERAAPWAGVTLGLGLLTKAFFLTAVPPFVLLLVWSVRKRGMRIRAAAIALGATTLIALWWHVRNILTTGSLSGVLQDAALRDVPLHERLLHIPEVAWLSALDSTFFSHMWFGGWSFLMLRAWIYHVLAVIAVLAIAGLIVAWVRQDPARRHVSTLAAIYGFFCLGLAYHVLMTFLVNRMSSSAGWYLCAIIVPEVVLAVVGLRALAPDRIRASLVALAAAMALLDFYGLLFVALPYYTGLIGHRPSGFLQAFHFMQIAETGAGEVLRRVAINEPPFIGPVVVAIAGCAYVIATGALVRVCATARRPSAQ